MCRSILALTTALSINLFPTASRAAPQTQLERARAHFGITSAVYAESETQFIAAIRGWNESAQRFMERQSALPFLWQKIWQAPDSEATGPAISLEHAQAVERAINEIDATASIYIEMAEQASAYRAGITFETTPNGHFFPFDALATGQQRRLSSAGWAWAAGLFGLITSASVAKYAIQCELLPALAGGGIIGLLCAAAGHLTGKVLIRADQVAAMAIGIDIQNKTRKALRGTPLLPLPSITSNTVLALRVARLMKSEITTALAWDKDLVLAVRLAKESVLRPKDATEKLVAPLNLATNLPPRWAESLIQSTSCEAALANAESWRLDEPLFWFKRGPSPAR